MDFIKQWCFYICITVIICAVFSFMSPKGNMSKLYKSVISLFILASFLYPFTQNIDFHFDAPELYEYSYAYDNTNSIANQSLKAAISAFLEENGVFNFVIDCKTSINENNEITVESVQIAVTNEYDCDNIKKLVFEGLNINVSVIHNGE